MKTIDLCQRSPAWHIWRSQGVSASEAATILGRNPYETAWTLWARRVGIAPPLDLSGNPFVQRGIALEDKVRQAFEERHNTLLLPACAEHSEHPVLRCSFDGLDDSGEPVELKVPGMKQYREVLEAGEDSTAYRLYRIQVQFQIAVAGAKRGWLCFDPCEPGYPAIDFEIVRDGVFMDEQLIPACLRFWEAIKERKEPPKDPERDVFTPQGEALEVWNADAAHYRALEAEAAGLRARLKAIGADQDEIEKRCLAAMGGYLLADTAGLRVCRFVKTTTDWKEVLAELVAEPPEEVLARHRKSPWQAKFTLTKQEPESEPAEPEPVTSPQPADVPELPKATKPRTGRARKATVPPAGDNTAAPRTVGEAAWEANRRKAALVEARLRGWSGELADLPEVVNRMRDSASVIEAGARYADSGAEQERQEALRLRAIAKDLDGYVAAELAKLAAAESAAA